MNMQNSVRISKIVMLLLIVCFIFFFCKNNNLNEVINISPKFSKNNLISLEKLYSIDITTFSITQHGELATDYSRFIDFDKNNNMYILDPGDNTITVINESGKIVNTFGGNGKAPNEFYRANTLIIDDDKIYVFEFAHDYKVVNLEGEYITTKYIPWTNRLKIDIIDNLFYVLEGRTDRTFTDLDLVLCVKSMDFKNNKELFKYKFSPGFKGPNYEFIFDNWILLTNNGEFFFPEDNLNKYSIAKYDKKGKPLFKFGRKYNIKKYSKKAKNRFMKIYVDKFNTDESRFPVSPPVVRKMISDDHGYLWVIVGETYEDNRDPNFENTIDIFDQNGIWLYSFKSKYITKNILFNDGKVYVVTPIDEKTYMQFINVYKVDYLNN